MTQPNVVTPYMLASFTGQEPQKFDSIQSAMQYAETLTAPTGKISLVIGGDIVDALVYASGVVDLASPDDEYPDEPEWPEQ